MYLRRSWWLSDGNDDNDNIIIKLGIISLQLLEMFSTTMCLHLETSVSSKVAVNTEAAVVGRRQQSSSPLSVSFYEAWEP